MSETPDTASQVVFGADPLWVSVAIFVLTYAVILTEKVNRAVVAMLGAGHMIVLGVISQDDALGGIDFNTLGLLVGMMVIVAVTRKSGVFQFVAMWSAQQVKAHPLGLLLALSFVTAVFSALLDNVTTVLLIAPVTLLITSELKVSPYPFLFAEIFASNIGGTATLIGDPPNIMIGSAAKLSFNDFVLNLAPIVPLILVCVLPIIYLLWRKQLITTDEARQRIMAFDAPSAITDVSLLVRSLAVLALVMAGFIAAHPLQLEPATIALFGAALLLLLDNFRHPPERQSEGVHETFGEVEWITIFFFIGLFILVHGIEQAGVLDILATEVVAMTAGNLATTAMAILWISAIASAILDNIPFVATMIPMIKSMAPTFGGAENLAPLWWSLAFGACLGGNGSLIGASANLIVAGFAERAGHRIAFVPFLLAAFPLMLLTVAVAAVYVYFRYLI